MQTIQLFIENTRVDLFKDESVTITDTIKNIKDISKVFTTFSQQFSLPASSTNNLIFKHYYNYDIVNGFDARARVNATIKLNGVDFKQGKIKLNNVALKNNKPHAYKIVFYGKAVDLKDIVGEDKLNNLQFIEVKASGTTTSTLSDNLVDSSANFLTTVSEGDRVHNQTDGTYATVTAVSSNTELRINQDIFVSGDDYRVLLSPLWENDSIEYKLQLQPSTAKNTLVAPLITHGLQLYYKDGEHISDTGNLWVDSGGGTHNHGVSYTDLKFALRVHSIIEAIENTYSDIEFTTDFFNTTNYNYYNLYMWLNRKSGEVSTSTSVNSFQFTIDSWSGGDLNEGGAGLGSTYGITSDFADFGTSFSMSIADSTTAYTIEFFKNQSLVYTTSRTASQGAYTLGTAELGAISTMAGTWHVVISANANVIISNISITLQGIIYDEFGGTSSYTNTITSGNINTPAVATFDIADQMPEIKVIDFINGLFKMFNLIAFVNDEDKIEVRTLDNDSSDSYYNLSNINTYDITEYVDVKESQVDVALPFKEVKFEYDDLKTFLAVNHEQLFNQSWGTEQWNEDSDTLRIDGPTYNVKLPFSHMKYERLIDLDSGNNTTIQWGWSVNENQDSYKGKPLLFYPLRNSGTDIQYRDTPSTHKSISNYIIPSNSRYLNDTSGEDNINFGPEINEYDRPLTSFSGTLFQNYYYNYITNVFRFNARIIKLTAYLPLRIILNYKLNDYIVVSGKKYRINSIKVNLLTNKSELELITT